MPIRPVKCWWDSPDSAIAIRALLNLVEFVFLYAVRWVRNNSMNGACWDSAHPFEAIRVNNDPFAHLGMGVVQYKLAGFGRHSAH